MRSYSRTDRPSIPIGSRTRFLGTSTTIQDVGEAARRRTVTLSGGRVALDKREGCVKGKRLPGDFSGPPCAPERLRNKTLEISREITFRWKVVPPTIDSA